MAIFEMADCVLCIEFAAHARKEDALNSKIDFHVSNPPTSLFFAY